jgi:hypothetical protein
MDDSLRRLQVLPSLQVQILMTTGNKLNNHRTTTGVNYCNAMCSNYRKGETGMGNVSNLMWKKKKTKKKTIITELFYYKVTNTHGISEEIHESTASKQRHWPQTWNLV